MEGISKWEFDFHNVCSMTLMQDTSVPIRQTLDTLQNDFSSLSSGRNAVALITYQSLGDILNGSFFSDRRGPKEVKINSQVISGSIGVKENVNLAKPVFLTFQHTRVSKIQAGSVGITFGGVLSRSWQETDCNSDHSESRQLEFPSWQW